MTIGRDQIVDGFPAASETPKRLASWYAQGMSDGIGKRLLMFDNTDAPSWELLRFRPEFTATPGFKEALLERVARLSQFRHASFPSARVVDDRASQGGLTLVSTYVAGRRLSEALERPCNATAAMRLIRQLTPALAALQQQGERIAHGVLTIERIVLTGDGRFMIREHVLGSAIERLGLSANRLWVEFGVVTRPADAAVARLDCRTDVIQLALVALSLMLGRRIDAGEYPHKIGNVLDHVARTSGRRSPLVFTVLRHWLERALQLNDRPFASAQEAKEALSETEGEAQGEEADFELPPAHRQDAMALRPVSVSERPPASVPPIGRTSSAPIESDDVAGSSRGAKSDGAVRSVPFLRVTKPADDDHVSVIAEGPDHVPLGGAPSLAAERTGRLRWIAAAAVAVAVAEAVVIGRLYYSRILPPPTEAAILVDSPQPGSSVLVNGRPAGITPLQLTVASGSLSILVQNPESSARTEIPSQVPAVSENRPPPLTQQSSQAVGGPRTTLVRPRPASIRLSSTIELDLFEGDRRLGSSRDGPIPTTPGRHEFDLMNSALGFESRRVVVIKEGEILSMDVTPDNGKVSINANPWAVAWIDGNSVGETPLANLSVPLGVHEFVFRHPQLGERRQTAIVRATGVTRVNANLEQ